MWYHFGCLITTLSPWFRLGKDRWVAREQIICEMVLELWYVSLELHSGMKGQIFRNTYHHTTCMAKGQWGVTQKEETLTSLVSCPSAVRDVFFLLSLVLRTGWKHRQVQWSEGKTREDSLNDPCINLWCFCTIGTINYGSCLEILKGQACLSQFTDE